jgi:hypothetical protein
MMLDEGGTLLLETTVTKNVSGVITGAISNAKINRVTLIEI